MNAPHTIDHLMSAAGTAPRLREIPYNYTSFSDREIVLRLLGARASWPGFTLGAHLPRRRHAHDSRDWARCFDAGVTEAARWVG